MNSLWRIAPVGALAHRGVAAFLTLIAFVFSSRYRWGVNWAWHFVAAAAFFLLVLGIGHLGAAMGRRRDARWRAALPFLVDPLPSRDGDVLVRLHPVPARLAIPRQFTRLQRGVLRHDGLRIFLRRDLRKLLAQARGLERVRLKVVPRQRRAAPQPQTPTVPLALAGYSRAYTDWQRQRYAELRQPPRPSTMEGLPG